MISAWLLYFLVYQLLSKVDDVTAQTSCVISPDMASLAIRDNLVRNVEFHCQCMDDNGMITTGTSWFRGSTLYTGTLDDPNLPTDAPSILFIAMPFNNSVAGTYTCSPDSTFPNVPPGDSITLNAQVAAASPPRSCNIVSTSLPTVTTPSGAIANGTEDVILYCICMLGGVAVGPTEWSFNSTSVTATQANGTNPYFRDNVPSPLIIPLFVTGNDGTYECGSLGTLYDSITLTLPVNPQATCVISPNITSLVIRTNLVRDIEFHCQCMDDNGMITTGTSWFRGSTLYTGTLDDPNLPTDAPSILLIPQPFTSSDAGTYTCSPVSTFPTMLPPGDAITLTARVPTPNSPRSCNIISTSLPTVTTPSGMIANGTEDVILYCTCIQDNVAVGPVLWFFNDTQVTATQANGSNPYYRDNVPSPLIIPLFVASNDGTYRCGSDINIESTSDNNIILTLPVVPSINPEVMDKTQDEGESASFTCQATGGPAPTISWYFNSTPLSNGTEYTISEMSVNTTTIISTLTIMSVESSDVGTYTCNATNVVSTDTSSGVLTVNVAPNITTPMEGQQFNIIVGSNGSITCTATGYPVPTVVWQNSDGSSLSNNRLVSGSPVMSSTGVGNETSVSVELMVIGAMRVDTGMYRCSANNSVRNTTRNINITVQSQTRCVISPDFDMLTIRNDLGRDVDLHCQCMDDNGIITGIRWFLPNMSIVSNESSNRPYSTGTAPSRLNFTSPFTSSDAGTYTCSPDDTFPTIPPGDNITLNTAADPNGDVNCTIVSTNLPTVTAAGGVIANGTQNVILYCICMRINSMVTVGRTFWFFNGNPITLTGDDGSGNPYSRNNVPSTLIIPSFVAPHDGNYSCNHGDMFIQVATLGDTITLTLPVQPIATAPAMVSVNEGENITINCTATGAPAPSVNWISADGSSLTDSRYIISDTSSSVMVNDVYQVTRNLIIMNSVREDTGMEYSCTATNVLGTAQSNVSITVLFPPSIGLEVMDETHNEGENVSFTCQATGRPVPTIGWYFNNTLLAHGMRYTISEMLVNTTTISSTLTIMSVASSDVGTYTCNATNVVSTDTSSGVLTVNVAPTITTPMEGQQFNITEGRNGSITCTATGYPAPTVAWQNSNGSSLNNSRLVTGDPVNMYTGVGNETSVSVELMVIGAMRVDTGMYRCSANNSINSTTRNINITVQYPPIINPEVMNQTQDEEQSVSFTCQATGIPVPTIRWYFNGTPVNVINTMKYTISEMSVNTTGNNVTLTIMSVESSDVGTYTCNATNVLSTDTSSGVLTVNVAPTITTPMEGQQFNITEGRNGSITCTATGYPIPTVVWQNIDGISLSNNRLVSGPVNMSSTGVGNETSVSVELMVIGAMRVDTGMYRCSANNSVDSTSRNITITVQYAPNIIGPMNQTINEGGIASFNCQASGEPLPTISWYFNGLALDDSNTAKYMITDRMLPNANMSVLNIMDVESSDSGTYTCNATNVVSTDTSFGVLIVNVSPTITTPMEGQQQLDVIEGRNGSITCTATGYPAPTVVWQNIDGSDLSNNRLVSGDPVNMSTGVGNEVSVSVELMVIGAMREDNRMYRCSANNSVGNTTTNIRIIIQFGPSTKPVIDQTENEGGTASFICEADGVPIPIFSWYFNGLLLDDSNTAKYDINSRSDFSILVITSVNSLDVGTYTCNATNVVSSNTSSGVLTVNVTPTISTLMEGQQFNITEGSNGSITCTATGYPVPTVVWQNSDGSSLSNNRLVSGSPVNMSSTGVGNETSVSVELMLIGAMRVDTGMYRCSATNSVGDDTSNISITVQFAPEITIPPSNITTINGSEAVLNCTVVGDPLPSISWFVTGGINLSTLLSNGLMIPFDDQGRINDSLINSTMLNSTTIHSRMRLPETAPFVAGEYACRASNFLGSINRTATLTVHVPPTVITPNGSRVVTDEGTSLLVDCTATGIPPPNITWQDPSGSELPNNDNVRIILEDRTVPQLMADDGFTFLQHVTRTLVINNANDSDTGNYTCTADNGIMPVDNNTVEVFVRVVPVITASPTNITVVSPDGATFNCTATAKPQAVIQWTTNNGTVLTDTLEKFTINNITEGDCIITNPPSGCVITSILEIANSVPNDDGEYVCTAINPAGNVTASASLTVHVEPNILQPVENSVFTINETDTYSITCNATGIPAPMTFIWLKDGVVQNYSLNATDRISVSQPSDPVPYSTSDGDVQSVSQVLTISPAVGLTTNSAIGNDSGVYTCQVSNGLGDGASVNVELVVQVPPVVMPESSPVIGVEGNSTVLRFFVINAFPPVTIDNVRWLLSRGGTITDITNNTMMDNITLTFEMESNSTTQMYSLNVSNIQPNYTARFYLNVSNPAGVDTNFINFIVEGPPDIEIRPADVTEIDDSDVKLVCNAIARPQHNITWMFQRTNTNNTAMIINTSSPDPTMKYLIDDNINSTSFGTLTITNLQYSDRGVYTCIAANVHGSVYAEAMVSVQVKPTYDMIVGGGRINISLPINLTCTVIGVPLPAIVWQLNGNDINLTSDCVENSYNASLDFGSELGSGFGSPNCRINQTLNLLDDIVSNAVSDSQDIITLGMYELSQLVVESTLTIRSLERSDNGSYTCNVTNMLPGVSIVTDSAPIFVLERPEPVNVTVKDQGSRWVLVGWDAPYNGNSEIDGYIVYLRNVDSDSNFTQVSSSAGGTRKRQISSQLTTTSTSYNITEGILPGMQYQFTAVACNQLGCGEFGEPSQDVSTNEERPETPPVNCSATAINSTAIMIMWSPPVMPNGVITNYNVSYVPGQSLSTADYSADGNVSVAIGNNDTAYVVTGLRIATDYHIAIAAHTMEGIGPYSNDNCTVQTMEDVPDGPPLNVILTSPTSTSINVNWDFPNASLRNGIITNHQLNYTEVSQPLNWTTVLLNASTSYLIEGLKIFTQYYVSVRAGTKVTGFGLFSELAINRTLNDTPSAPRNLTIVDTTMTTLELSWIEPEILNGIIQIYRIYFSPSKTYEVTSDDFNNATMAVDTPDNETSFIITNLIPDTTYNVFMSALTGAGEGNNTATIIDITPPDLPPPPSPPRPAPNVMRNEDGIALVMDNEFIVIFTRPSNINGRLGRHEIVIVVFSDVDTASTATSDMFRDNINSPSEAYTRVTDGEVGAAYVAIELDDSAWPSDGMFTIGASTTANNQPLRAGREDTTSTTSSNQPLRTGFAYRAFIIAYPLNNNEQPGSSASPLSDPFVNPSPPSSGSSFPIGIVIGVLVAIAIAVLVIIILICICYRRRKSKELAYSPSILASSRYSGGINEKDTSSLGIVATQSNAGEIGLTTFRNASDAHAPIPTINFSAHIEKLFANDKYGFSEEYKEIQESSPKHESECFSMPVNKQKNRYQNIVCFDHSRVKLQPFDSSEGSDYIHANYLPGYTHPKEYIGCQGPLPGTIADFWRMIWEQECPTIVMLTGLVEKMKVKCSQYWPNNGSAVYGNISVTLDGSVQYADYVVRTLRVQLEGDSTNERTIKLFHFTAWPDFGVPLHATPLLGFINRLRQHHRYGDHRPLLIHCSAGVGRTGTLIVVDVELQRARKENIVDPFGSVMKLRENRSNIVQTEAQYVFLHDAILEGVESGKTDVPADKLRSRVESLSEMDKSVGETGFENEFRRLTNRIDVSKFNTGSKDVNKFKNRLVNVLPYDHCRVILQGKPGDEGSDYINASFIDGYHQKAAYIVTQGPMQNTCGDFWRMIWEKNIASIVMLTKLTEKGTDMCAPYWPDEVGKAINFDDFVTELLDVKDFEDYTQRELKLTKEAQTTSDSHTIIQYHYTGWPEHGSPSSGAGMIDLIDQVIKRQQQSGNHPIVVHCSAGVGRSGAFCAISTAIERVKAEGTVDLFHGVKHLRTQRPHMVQTSEQYIFCYKAVLEFVESLDTYSNFK